MSAIESRSWYHDSDSPHVIFSQKEQDRDRESEQIKVITPEGNWLSICREYYPSADNVRLRRIVARHTSPKLLSDERVINPCFKEEADMYFQLRNNSQSIHYTKEFGIQTTKLDISPTDCFISHLQATYVTDRPYVSITISSEKYGFGTSITADQKTVNPLWDFEVTPDLHGRYREEEAGSGELRDFGEEAELSQGIYCMVDRNQNGAIRLGFSDIQDDSNTLHYITLPNTVDVNQMERYGLNGNSTEWVNVLRITGVDYSVSKKE